MINVALVGLGKMGISHYSLINAHPDVSLVAVCDKAEYMLDVLGKNLKVKTYSDLDVMLAAEQLDAVFVSTPSKFHADMVRKIIDSDIHVFCEKPLCLDPADSLQIAEAAQSRKLVSQVGYHYRFVATFSEMKRLLDLGAIGDIHHVRAQAYGPVVLRPKGSTWRTAKSEGGGCLYDYACHAIDLVNYLVGAPTAVSGGVMGQVFSRDVEDEVYATLHFDSGASGQLAINWSDESHRKMSTEVTVFGTNGKITADRQEMRIYLRNGADLPDGYELGWNVRYITDLAKEVWFYLRGEEYSEQIDQFVQAVKLRDTATRSSFTTAAEADSVAAAIGVSARNGGARAEVDTLSSAMDLPKRGGWSILGGRKLRAASALTKG